VLVLTAILTIGGLLSYLTIPKEANPSVEIPQIVVTTIYPGASPDDIESLVTQHLEEEIQGISGIKEIRSSSTEGVSTVIVEFDPDVSMDDAFQKVRDKVDIAKAELPTEVEEPLVNEIDIQEFPIMTINMAAGYSLARLKEVAEDLQDQLESIPSILEVDLIGGLEREVQINVDLNALKAYNLAFDDVISTVREENTNLPGGSIDVDRANYLVRVNGEIEDPAELNDLVIDTPDGVPVYVRDIATVVFGFKDRATYARLEVFQEEDEDDNLVPLSDEELETLQVVSLNVKQRSGANILDTVAELETKMAAFPFPPGTRYVITGDMSVYVEAMLRDLENNIISGLFFVVGVLLFFLGVRNAFLVGVAIPMSMFLSFILFQTMGYTLNFIILFSLIIALGMLVDNAIVIIENIYRFREKGHSRFEAARLGTGEVGAAVTASTLTTVAAFAPMLFWPGIIGEFMSYLPLTLIITLSCSLFVALVINPVVTALFARLENEETPTMKRASRIAATALVVLTGLVIGLANWKTLVVLVASIPVLVFLHKKVFKPAGDWFVVHGMPRIVANYRVFLQWMLVRDYRAPKAMLRNTFALGAFTLGVVLLILGGVVSAMAGQVAGLILLFPGGLLAGVGLLGIFVHVFEILYQGGRATVKFGAYLAAIIAVLLGIVHLSPRPLEPAAAGVLIAFPLFVILFGALGWALNTRERLILTDNRARLLNGVLGSLFGIFILFALAPTGVEFFPTTDPNQIAVEFESPLGTNVETSNGIAEVAQARIDSLLHQNPLSRSNVKSVLTNVGVGGDIMFGGGTAGPELARVTLNMADYEDRAEKSTITMAALREQLKGIPGTEVSFTQDQNGPPTGAPVNIEISGEEFDTIVRIAREIKMQLVEASETGAIPGLVDVTDNLNTGRPELQVEIDRERAAQYGLSTGLIASTIRSAINGAEAGKYRTGEDEYDIIVRLAEADRSSLESLRNLTILDEGTQIPLVAVADMHVRGGLGAVTRLDLSRVATVTGKAADGFTGNEVLASTQAFLAEYLTTIPEGYTITYTGESEEQDESFTFLTYVLLIGVALIFMIMVAQFNSVSAPFIIMVAVGLSLIGVLLGLIVTRTPFGLMTFIGVISLAGIVVNNGIVLIDYTMKLRERGMAKREAIIEAGATRLRPVILTALTTVIGLVPLTFGLNIDFVGLLTDFDPNFQIGSENTQFWGPMGISIISGLTFATFLTLVIVPVMYSAFDSIAQRLGQTFAAPELDGDGAPTAGNGYAAGVVPTVRDGHAHAPREAGSPATP
jgi:multidrug efflux pump subunit AcrB